MLGDDTVGDTAAAAAAAGSAATAAAAAASTALPGTDCRVVEADTQWHDDDVGLSLREALTDRDQSRQQPRFAIIVAVVVDNDGQKIQSRITRKEYTYRIVISEIVGVRRREWVQGVVTAAVSSSAVSVTVSTAASQSAQSAQSTTQPAEDQVEDAEDGGGAAQVRGEDHHQDRRDAEAEGWLHRDGGEGGGAGGEGVAGGKGGAGGEGGGEGEGGGVGEGDDAMMRGVSE